MVEVSSNLINSKILEGKELCEKVLSAQQTLNNKSGLGNDFLGWLDLYDNYDKTEFDRVKEAAKRIRENSQIVIVIGIGGSYLGAKACITALKGEYYNEFNCDGPKIYFAGHNINGENYTYLLELVKNYDASVIVISKSGTTLEPAIGFRMLKDAMEDKYKKEASKRIYAITDKQKGALKKLSDEKGYETFIVPDNIGGRYSVITPVGLLPLAVAGINIDDLYEGMHSGQMEYKSNDINNNEALKYAMTRYALYNSGKNIEVLLTYNPRFAFIQEWWKQLYGESECKESKGLIPMSMNLTTDLHSLGQLLQDGNKIFFETTLINECYDNDITVPYSQEDIDGLNYVANKSLSYVNQKAYEGTKKAHLDGGVSNLEIKISKIDEFTIGKLLYFFMYACGVSAYMLDINPFNQPGVEEYKKNMFRLLKEE